MKEDQPYIDASLYYSDGRTRVTKSMRQTPDIKLGIPIQKVKNCRPNSQLNTPGKKGEKGPGES